MALKKPALVLKSLREQVYDFLKERMIQGELRPGAYLNLKAIAAEIGVSMTPLRDALLQLEREGFITILPRRGVMVAPLTSEKIRDIYEIIGALEAVSLVSSGSLLNRKILERMSALNSEMLGALENDNFDLYYARNLAFHNIFLDLSPNEDLVQMVRTFKQRLYDFPGRRGFVKEWELRSVQVEHSEILRLLAEDRRVEAADYLRDVHWGYKVQKSFIRKYYFGQENDLDRKRGKR